MAMLSPIRWQKLKLELERKNFLKAARNTNMTPKMVMSSNCDKPKYTKSTFTFYSKVYKYG